MDAVSEVKSRLSIEDVISEYVQLKRAGKNFKGLSPFSAEKTPSFVVSPEKQIWHDFSSGRGGDMFTFIQEVEGLDFKGSLELLARKAGVDLEQFQSKGSNKGPDKERLYSLLDATAKFYQVQFSTNKEAYEYIFKKRGYTKQTVLDFRIGYSPDGGRAATDYLLGKKFTEAELHAAGVSVERQGRTRDMFRGRIMVPLSDPFGQVIGFTARILKDVEGAPKYINTPATPLYDKSRHIYGLHLAKKAIQKEKIAVMVEGNLDVIASHQAGITNVVAAAGTALTEMQLKALSRLTPDVRLAFDQDKAGIAAAERAIPIAGKLGISLSIVTIPSGKDPDELISQDPALWTDAISQSEPALDWLLKTYQERLDLTAAAGKRQFSDVSLAIVKLLSDPVEQDHYIQKIAALTEVHADSLRAKLSNVADEKIRHKAVKPAPQNVSVPFIEDRRAQERFLSIVLMLPATRQYLDLTNKHMFNGSDAQTVATFLQTNRDFDGKVAEAPGLQPILDYVKILSLQFEELYGEIDTTELQYEAARLRATVIDHFVKKQNQIIRQKLKNASEDEAADLLARVNKLNQLLRRTTE
ncbi:MAG: DNA primase [Candidatus Saccharimonadales bacterium]